MEYIGYVICIIIAYFFFRIGWRIFGKTLSRWQRRRMSEWSFFQKRLAYSIALAFIFGGIPAYVIFSNCHPDHKDAYMNLNKENKKSTPPEGLKFIDVGTFNESSPYEENLDENTINEPDDVSLSEEESNIRESDFHLKDSIQ